MEWVYSGTHTHVYLPQSHAGGGTIFTDQMFSSENKMFVKGQTHTKTAIAKLIYRVCLYASVG